MSDQETIFESNESTSVKTPEQTSTAEEKGPEPSAKTDAFADLLASIRTEDGRQKYTDVEAALKSLPHAQEHISRLEREMNEMKEALSRTKSAEEILAKIEEKAAQKQETPVSAELDLSQLEALVDKTLTMKQQQALAQGNIQQVVGKMSEMYGEKAEQTFYEVGQQVGLSPAELNALAAKSPNAVFKLLGVDSGKAPVGTTKTSSSINTEALANNNTVQASAKVPFGASTKQLVDAWRNAKPN